MPKSSYFQNIRYTSPPTAKTHLTEGFVVCRLMTDHEQTLKNDFQMFWNDIEYRQMTPGIIFKRWFQSQNGSAEMISGVGAKITFYLEEIETSAGKLIFNAWRVCPNDLKLAINITYWCFRMLFECSWTWLVGFHFGSIFFWFSFHWHPTDYLRSCNLIPFTWCLWHKTDAW